MFRMLYRKQHEKEYEDYEKNLLKWKKFMRKKVK